MDAEKLGPCPLCGGDKVYRDSVRQIHCPNDECPIRWMGFDDGQWSTICVLAASERRMRAALERCRARFREYSKIHRDKGTYDGDRKARANEAMAAMCDEALKGGEG